MQIAGLADMSLGSPASHIPSKISDASIIALFKSIGLPQPHEIKRARVKAEYHAIYFMSLNSPKPEQLVLRVSGPHLPKIKTENEAAIMQWVSKNTTIPIPRVTRYDSSTENPIRHEYILLSRDLGQSASDVYAEIDNAQVEAIIDQLIDVLVQLHTHEWPGIGGLKINDIGDIELGPVIEETFWQVPDIIKYWPPGETVETLNVGGPFDTYVEYISAHVRKYIHMIIVHEKLAFMLEHVPRLESFLVALDQNAEELNRVKLRLAHKDLHFANILYDMSTGRITSILDWEFSGVVPFTRWNPSRAFLWNGQDDETSLAEKCHLYAVFLERCETRGINIPKDASCSSPGQEAMQEATTYLRAITEVAPRGEKADLVKWKDEVLRRISFFGV